MYVYTLIYSVFSKAVLDGTLMFQGIGYRLRGGANAVRVRAPQIGGEKLVCFFFICKRLFLYRTDNEKNRKFLVPGTYRFMLLVL